MPLKHPYCLHVLSIKDTNDVDKMYHDNHYGRRIEDDNELFCRLIMEINQAGLSWRTILQKEKGMRVAYHGFSIKKVAKYKEKDVARLMNDTSIIRNRLKINASIYNAKQIIKLQKEYGSFRHWLDLSGKEVGTDKNMWVQLFKKHFKFVGGEIVGEFLMSIDMLPYAHDPLCTVHRQRKKRVV